MRRQRRSASGAIRHDLVTFVYQSFVCDRLDRPPYRFDKFVVVSYVRVVHIHPIAYSVRHSLPLAFILPYALFALLYKRLDAVFLYLGLAVYAEQFLYFEFYRQSVRIPARFSSYVIAFHSLISGNYILHNSGEDMSDMRLAVCRRRTVIERKRLLAFILLYAFFEYLVFFPERDHIFFSLAKIHSGINLFIHLSLLLKYAE